MALTKQRQPAWTPDQLAYLKKRNHDVPRDLWLGVTALIFLFGAYSVSSRVLNRWRVRRYHSLHQPPTRVRRAGSTAVAFLPSAMLASWRKATYRRGQVVQWLGMGSAAQLVTVACYVALNLGLAFSGAKGHPDYQAHHAARLCFANIPILVGLSSKELGVIGWITGLSSATLNTLHRWSGRLVFFLATYHVFGRAYTNVPRLDPSAPGMGYQGWGIAGFVLWSSLVLSSVRFVRVRWHTFFIFSHIFLFCTSMIALSLHRPQVASYLVAGCVIYILDRLIRLASTVYYALFRPIGRGQAPSATAEVVSPDAIRVRYRTGMRWRAGQHAYLHIPLLGAGGHPFSIASTYLPITNREYEPTPSGAEQVFLIRVHAGITRKLYQSILETDVDDEDDRSRLRSRKAGDTVRPIFPAFVEGPYGHDPLAHHYESVLLICGGSGVSFGLSILLDLVRRARNRELGGAKRLVTTRVTWVWTVREEEQIEWATDSLRDALYYAPCDFLELAVYVTGSARRGFADSSSRPARGGSALPRSNTLISGSSYRSDVSGIYLLPPLAEEDDQTNDMKRSTSLRSNTTPFLLNLQEQTPRVPDPSSSSASTSRYSHSLSSEAPTAATSRTTSAEHGHEILSGPFQNTLLPSDYSRAPTAPRIDYEASSPPRASLHTPIPLNHHRPPIRDILDAVVSSTTYSGSVLVGTCGPLALTDEVGAAVSDAIRPRAVREGEFRRNITLHAETFGW